MNACRLSSSCRRRHLFTRPVQHIRVRKKGSRGNGRHKRRKFRLENWNVCKIHPAKNNWEELQQINGRIWVENFLMEISFNFLSRELPCWFVVLFFSRVTTCDMREKGEAAMLWMESNQILSGIWASFLSLLKTLAWNPHNSVLSFFDTIFVWFHYNKSWFHLREALALSRISLFSPFFLSQVLQLNFSKHINKRMSNFISPNFEGLFLKIQYFSLHIDAPGRFCELKWSWDGQKWTLRSSQDLDWV